MGGVGGGASRQGSVAEWIGADYAHVVLETVVGIQPVPPHTARGAVGVAHSGGSAVPRPGIILIRFGRSGPGALVLQTHVVPGLMRGRVGDVPVVAAAEVIGEDEAAHWIAGRTGTDA